MEWDMHDLPTVVEKDRRPDIINKMEPDEFYALIKSKKPELATDKVKYERERRRKPQREKNTNTAR